MIEPFQIDIAAADLEDLKERLTRRRLGTPPIGDAWQSGVEYTYLDGLADYWRDGFDWRAREAHLNQYDHSLATVDGQMVHFVRVGADRSRYGTATPIVLTHGWPYSFHEFLTFAGHLSDPLHHGGPAEHAFDIVIPSLPGFCFSPPLQDARFTGDVVARLWHRLMTETLGYQRFGTYGEDVGASVSDWLGALFPGSIIGVFATHAAFPPEERAQNLTGAEERFRGWLADKWRTSAAYSEVQSTRPDTLAVALDDSPIGLLAWMLDKYVEWSGSDFESSWSRDEILTTVSLYWFTRTIGSSFLPYYEGRRAERPVPVVEVPVAVAVHPGERGFPREYAERTYADLRSWAELPRGGHFTAKQSPDLVANAMLEFFGSLVD